jgi:hypothetical protein
MDRTETINAYLKARPGIIEISKGKLTKPI